jgi:hypothetical protein
MFEEDVARSFSLDLSDLSRDTWSLLPQAGDFIAEVRTRRFDTLTFARSSGEPEDVTLFHRARKKNIAAYASPSKLSSRGRFYNEDDLVEYDIQHYDIDVTFIPERSWLEGRARLRLRVKAYALGALTLKLHEQLTVRSIESDELGRLLFLRVRNQNSVVVNMPSAVGRDMELTLSVAYQGPMRTQTLDQESLDLQEGQLQSDDLPMIPGEPNWLFSNRSYWYPQGQVTDYATSTVRVTVPAGFGAAATGTPASGMAMPPIPASGASSRITYTFVAQQPARYIGLVVSKLMHVDSSRVTLPLASKGKTAAAPEELTYVGAGVLVPPRKPVAAIAELGARNTLQLSVSANRRQLQRGRDAIGTATEIVQFYSSIVGDAPYDSLGIAMVENSLPGGHSPAYMVMLNNPTPLRSPYTWRNDPAAFSHFPEFYLAHEVAHQWWGQAVGWQNYHEQWISEGFAQYFAALYARERRGEPAFRELLKQFRRWAIDQSDQGPIYLGYRLGHLKNDGRAFRAVIYNKSAGVLHMLRRLLGDEVFFAGLRRFYADYRFKKAGTDDFRRAMEAVSGHSLERFFQRWIFESGVPRVRYSTAIEGQELVVRFEQANGEPDVLFDLPVTVSISYADKTVDEIVPLNAATVEKRIPLSGAVRSIDVNTDNAAIATFERR